MRWVRLVFANEAEAKRELPDFLDGDEWNRNVVIADFNIFGPGYPVNVYTDRTDLPNGSKTRTPINPAMIAFGEEVA